MKIDSDLELFDKMCHSRSVRHTPHNGTPEPPLSEDFVLLHFLRQLQMSLLMLGSSIRSKNALA